MWSSSGWFFHMLELSEWYSEYFWIVTYDPKLLSWFFAFKNQKKSIFGYEKFPGWVLTHIRTFKIQFPTFFIFSMWSKNGFLLQNTTYSFSEGEEFFGMSSYTCQNFQNMIPEIFTLRISPKTDFLSIIIVFIDFCLWGR